MSEMDKEAEEEEEELEEETVQDVSVSDRLSSCCAGAWRATSATDLGVRSAIDSPFDNKALSLWSEILDTRASIVLATLPVWLRNETSLRGVCSIETLPPACGTATGTVPSSKTLLSIYHCARQHKKKEDVNEKCAAVVGHCRNDRYLRRKTFGFSSLQKSAGLEFF